MNFSLTEQKCAFFKQIKRQKTICNNIDFLINKRKSNLVLQFLNNSKKNKCKRNLKNVASKISKSKWYYPQIPQVQNSLSPNSTTQNSTQENFRSFF